jgi:hypothetical protein
MTRVTDRIEDQWLVERLQRGEAHAIEALVARYGAWIPATTRTVKTTANSARMLSSSPVNELDIARSGLDSRRTGLSRDIAARGSSACRGPS